MTKLNQVYKCAVCGNIVEVVHNGAGTLVCCGQEMNLQTENIVEAATEKHIPIVKKSDSGIKVQVGEILHPMINNHFIEWIEVLADGKSYKKFLQPKDKPEVEFKISAKQITVRAYCNLHGLWKN